MEPISYATNSFSWSALIQLTFLVSLLIYAIYSIILYYHWNQYSIDKKLTVTTYVAYFGVTLPIIVTLGILALFIS